MESSAKIIVTPNICAVARTGEELRQRWQAAVDRPLRLALAQASRIVIGITKGRGGAGQLATLGEIARRLQVLDPDAGDLLQGALAEFQPDWQAHAVDGRCDAGVCFAPAVAPCRAACPADIDIPGFLAHIGSGHYDDALQVISRDNPLPHSCGLVCPAPCETACLRSATGAPLFIRPLKAVAARESRHYQPPAPRPATGKRVAVVGSGPAGLTVAYYLAAKGHGVEIFEAREQAGGMLRYGIPSYRLPTEVLNAEIDHIRSLGVIIRTDAEVSSLAELKARGFDACYLALGLQKSRRLGVSGDDLPFVLGGTDFLGDVGKGGNPRVGPRVVVVGGGNTAVDAAMTALRQGARHVAMVYRGRRGEMKASPHEIVLAEAEGVEILELWTPAAILPDHKIVFRRSAKASEAERRAGGEELVLEVDHVLAGIGQEAHLSCVDGSKVVVKAGHIETDPLTSATAAPGVFAGGDVAYGASTVVAAVRAGKNAAASIHAFMMGDAAISLPVAPEPPVPPLATDAAVRSLRLRATMPERNALERRLGYQQIELGLSEQDAKVEASRCLRCDMCIGCGLCELVCSEVGAEALRMVATASGRLVFDDFTRPQDRCIGCGACAEICPTGAITARDRDGRRHTAVTGTEVRDQPMVACSLCGRPYVAQGQFERLQARLPQGSGLVPVCPDCARDRQAAQIAVTQL